MDDLLASLILFSRDSAVAVCISVVGLLVSLLGYLKIRTVGNAIQYDRDLMETLLELPEIQFHLLKASEFLSPSRRDVEDEPGIQEALRDGLNFARYSIDSFIWHYSGRRDRGNPYLLAADRSKRRGAVRQAIFWYERALETSETLEELGVELSTDEIRHCLVEIQKCHLMRFDLTNAKRISQRAQKLEAPCPTEEEIRTKGWILCIAASLELLWRRLRHPAWNRPRRFPVNPKKD